MPAPYFNELQKIFEVQRQIGDLHPLLQRVFPIAIAENDQLSIFEPDPANSRYQLVLQAPTPMPIPAGVRAAFPIDFYGNKIACVVTGDVFETQDGYVTILHEFIHCQQFETCELKIKQTLEIYQQAQAAHDPMWEINYPFPYDLPEFINHYTDILAGGEADYLLTRRLTIRRILKKTEYEYMVWQEWKEGLARYIENQLQRRLGLHENQHGATLPLTRVSFYAGGARFIQALENERPGISLDIESLFQMMNAIVQ